MARRKKGSKNLHSGIKSFSYSFRLGNQRMVVLAASLVSISSGPRATLWWTKGGFETVFSNVLSPAHSLHIPCQLCTPQCIISMYLHYKLVT